MNNTNAIVEYTREISPMLRDLDHQKELLKDFIDSDDEAQRQVEAIKEAQAILKSYLEDTADSAEILDKISDIKKDIKEALKSIAKVSEFKPAQWQAYLKARNKEEGVVKVITKGELFVSLDEVLK